MRTVWPFACALGAFFEAVLTLRSEDGLLDDHFDVRLRFLPEPVIAQAIELPAKLQSRRKHADMPAPKLSLIFDGAIQGQLYVSDYPQPGMVEEQAIAGWQLDSHCVQGALD